MSYFELPKLPYAYDALEPYIDENTVEIHYTKHHLNYLNNLNKIIEDNPLQIEGKTLEQLLKDIDSLPENLRTPIINQGGGYINHNLYWQILSPNGGGKPSGEFLQEIEATFDGYENFKTKLIDAATNVFGSGYGFLVIDNDTKSLEIMQTKNQESPISYNKTPVIIIDVWEHAYYLRYQNRRREYIESLFKIFNWDEIERIYYEAKI